MDLGSNLASSLVVKTAYLGRLKISDTKSPNKKLVIYKLDSNSYSGHFHVKDLKEGQLEVGVIINNEDRKGLALVKTIGKGYFAKKEDGILVRARDLSLI